MADYVELGRPTPRVDGLAKVTGTARYVADQTIPGMISGRLVHSTRSHARILGIDTAAARALPGVHAVITGEDVGQYLYGRRMKDMPVLARGVVRYSGERLAAVAAETEEIARHAADLIDVTYEDLPAVLDVTAALEPDAPLLHPDFNTYRGVRPLSEPSNAYQWTVNDRGDLDAGFAEADIIVEGEYETQRHHQAYVETASHLVPLSTRECLCAWRSEMRASSAYQGVTRRTREHGPSLAPSRRLGTVQGAACMAVPDCHHRHARLRGDSAVARDCPLRLPGLPRRCVRRRTARGGAPARVQSALNCRPCLHGVCSVRPRPRQTPYIYRASVLVCPEWGAYTVASRSLL